MCDIYLLRVEGTKMATNYPIEVERLPLQASKANGKRFEPDLPRLLDLIEGRAKKR